MANQTCSLFSCKIFAWHVISWGFLRFWRKFHSWFFFNLCLTWLTDACSRDRFLSFKADLCIVLSFFSTPHRTTLHDIAHAIPLFLFLVLTFLFSWYAKKSSCMNAWLKNFKNLLANYKEIKEIVVFKNILALHT